MQLPWSICLVMLTKERAAETGMPMRTIYYKSNLFDQAGMASLRSSNCIGRENGSDTPPSPQLCTPWNVSGSA